jgi:hypothetical protein
MTPKDECGKPATYRPIGRDGFDEHPPVCKDCAADCVALGYKVVKVVAK